MRLEFPGVVVPQDGEVPMIGEEMTLTVRCRVVGVIPFTNDDGDTDVRVGISPEAVVAIDRPAIAEEGEHDR